MSILSITGRVNGWGGIARQLVVTKDDVEHVIEFGSIIKAELNKAAVTNEDKYLCAVKLAKLTAHVLGRDRIINISTWFSRETVQFVKKMFFKTSVPVPAPAQVTPSAD